MRVISIAALATLIAGPAAALTLGETIAQEVCAWNRSYELKGSYLDEFKRSPVNGGKDKDYNTEVYFRSGVDGLDARCTMRIRLGMMSQCSEIAVNRSGNTLSIPNLPAWPPIDCSRL